MEEGLVARGRGRERVSRDPGGMPGWFCLVKN